MKRNIIVSFIAQIVSIALFLVLQALFIGAEGDGASTAYYIYSAVNIILVFLFYMIVGSVFLKPAQTQKRSLISIFVLSLALFILTIGVISVDFVFNTGDALFGITVMLNPMAYSLFALNTAVSSLYSSVSETAIMALSAFILIISSLVPSIFMWLGFKMENGKKLLANEDLDENYDEQNEQDEENEENEEDYNESKDQNETIFN